VRRAKPLPKPALPGSVPGMSHDPDDRDSGGGNRRGALIGLAIAAVLVIAGYYLMTALRNQGNMEDCLMSGRSNCAPLDIPTHK
jgi:hypothetical protein